MVKICEMTTPSVLFHSAARRIVESAKCAMLSDLFLIMFFFLRVLSVAKVDTTLAHVASNL